MDSDGAEAANHDVGRREVLAAAAGVAAAGASGYFAGTATAADGSASGSVGTSSSPYTRAYVDRVVFHDLGTDPSVPDGTLYYNSNA